jgi:hypothetical protein
MDDKATRAMKYRERAAQVRITAEDSRSDENRRLLLKVGKDYDDMALDLEGVNRSGRPIPKS